MLSYIAGKSSNCKSYDIISNGDYDIVLLEECKNIISKKQLHTIERYYIDSLECVNKNIPGRTIEEYQKEYKEINNDKIKEYKNQKIICPYCNIEFTQGNKTHHLRTKKHIYNINNL